MKVAFIVRSTFYSTFGGDSMQTISSARFLKSFGVDVDIILTHETIDYSAYQLLHFFNLIRPDDMLRHIRQSKLPFVVSSIFLDYSHYANTGNHPLYPLLYKTLGSDRVEYLKRIARSIFNQEPAPSLKYLFGGHRKAIRYVLDRTSHVLPNSNSEMNRLIGQYPYSGKYRVIPNGVDLNRYSPPVNNNREAMKVICVGRIEVRKNQLNLIRALNGSPYALYIIGKPAPNHKNYYRQCIDEAGEYVYFLDAVSDDELLHHYATAAVHVLPSRFETTGLSSLEAAAMGCRLVITACGDTREYFKEHVVYCDPEQPDSIRKAVDEAITSQPSQQLTQLIREQYNWEHAARLTAEAYREVLS